MGKTLESIVRFGRHHALKLSGAATLAGLLSLPGCTSTSSNKPTPTSMATPTPTITPTITRTSTVTPTPTCNFPSQWYLSRLGCNGSPTPLADPLYQSTPIGSLGWNSGWILPANYAGPTSWITFDSYNTCSSGPSGINARCFRAGNWQFSIYYSFAPCNNPSVNLEAEVRDGTFGGSTIIFSPSPNLSPGVYNLMNWAINAPSFPWMSGHVLELRLRANVTVPDPVGLTSVAVEYDANWVPSGFSAP